MPLEVPTNESPEEISKAEEALKKDPEAAGLSETRLELIENIRKDSNLEVDIFDQIVESFQYDDSSKTVRFKVANHEIILSREGGKYEFTVDGKKLPDHLHTKLWAKYNGTILRLKDLDNDIIREVRDEVEQERLMEDLGL